MTMKPLMPFHEWKTEFRKLEAPRVRPTEDYYQHYGCYVQKHRLAAAAIDTASPEEGTS